MGLSPDPTSTNACRHVCKYMYQRDSAAMLTSIQSVDVAPEVNLRITQARKHTRIYPGFETQGRSHQKSKIGVLMAPLKRTYVLQKLKEKVSISTGSPSRNKITEKVKETPLICNTREE